MESFQTCSSQTIDRSEFLSYEPTRYQYSDTSVQQKTIISLFPNLYLLVFYLHLQLFIQELFHPRCLVIHLHWNQSLFDLLIHIMLLLANNPSWYLHWHQKIILLFMHLQWNQPLLNLFIKIIHPLENNQPWNIKSHQYDIMIILPVSSDMHQFGIHPQIYVFYRNVSCLRSMVQYLYYFKKFVHLLIHTNILP